MALIQVNYLSKALFRTVPLQVILPSDKISFETLNYSHGRHTHYKTLYLLHGLLGNYTDWVSGTRIQRWAEEKDLAVVMPSGDNAFYVNSITPNNDYGTFIGEELVNITRAMFPLSDSREDTYIAGLSMGGFGALRNGLKYSGTFSRIGVLSGGLHVFDEDAEDIAGELDVFGDKAAAAETDKNPEVAMKDLIREGREKPEIYMACGLSDSLLACNRRYRDLLRENGFEVTWDEQPGGHEWDFWDKEIKKILDWLPLSDSGGLNSGSVKAEK